MMANDAKELARIAELACERAKKAGAAGARAACAMAHSFKVKYRDGRKEEIKAAVTRKLNVTIFADGRYSNHTTSQLKDKDVAAFVDDAVAMTRLLMPDPHRALAAAELYRGRSDKSLGLFDPAFNSVTMAQRLGRAKAAHDALREHAKDKLISAGAGVSDSHSLRVLRTTNGFSDQEERSAFWQWATLSAKDPSGRRPSDWDSAGSRKLAQLVSPERIGQSAAERTLAAIGAKAMPSITLPVIVENRAVGRLLHGFMAPLSGFAIDQRRSCFAKSVGKQVTAPLLSIEDAPLLPGGLGSRRFDGEGISAKGFHVVEKGLLRNFYFDSYYGKKLNKPPTTGGASNLVFSAGDKALDQLCQQAGKAILITSFLGGNSNSTTGDFSHGIAGYLIEGGKRTRPIASMNIAGNHTAFWRKLQQVGNDPYAHSSRRTPSLLFAPLLVSGT